MPGQGYCTDVLPQQAHLLLRLHEVLSEFTCQTIVVTWQDMENVVGDVVVAAGCIAYSGPFTPAFRQGLQQEWAALLKGASVPHTPGTNLIGTLQVSTSQSPSSRPPKLGVALILHCP